MAIFGNNQEVDANYQQAVANGLFGVLAAGPVGPNILAQSISIRAAWIQSSGPARLKAVLIRASDLQVVAIGAEVTFMDLAVGWRTSVFPSPVGLEPVDYYVCWIIPGGSWLRIYRSNESGPVALIQDLTNSYASPAAPSVTDIVSATAVPEIYCTYTSDVTINQPPVLNYIGPKSVVVGEPLSFTVLATDPDGDPLVYSAE